MTTMEVAKDLMALCRAGQHMDAVSKLYAPDIVSHEVNDPMKLTKGLDNVKAKNQWWRDNHVIHSQTVEGPWPNGDRFCVRHTHVITPKATGKQVTMDEMALYTVRNGKIVEETFFYGA